MIAVKTNSKEASWSLDSRYKVNRIVLHNNSYWVNKTGKNSEPVESSQDWDFIRSKTITEETIIIDGNEFKYKNNSDTGTSLVPAEGDLALFGIINEVIPVDVNDEYIPQQFAQVLRYISGDLSLLDSWEILSTIEIGPEEFDFGSPIVILPRGGS